MPDYHLLSLNRKQLVSEWELDDSITNVRPVVGEIHGAARRLSPFTYAGSDLLLLLGRMRAIARLLSLVILLMAVPLLWMGWILARTLSRLLILNERRLVGLALIRGVAGAEIGKSLLLALLIGGHGFESTLLESLRVESHLETALLRLAHPVRDLTSIHGLSITEGKSDS